MKLAIALAVLASVALVGCNDTHSTRCNTMLAAQIQQTNDLGGIVQCDPSYDPDEPATAQFVVQWNRAQPIVWIWERRNTDYMLRIHGWMGVYEVQAYNDGRVRGYDAGVPVAIEREALAWATAHD